MTRKRFPSAPNFWHASAARSRAASDASNPARRSHDPPELARKLLAGIAVQGWYRPPFGFLVVFAKRQA